MKNIELTEEEKQEIKDNAIKAFDKLVNEILNPTAGEERKQFRDGYLELYEHLSGIIKFTEKERDSYKRQIK